MASTQELESANLPKAKPEQEVEHTGLTNVASNQELDPCSASRMSKVVPIHEMVSNAATDDHVDSSYVAASQKLELANLSNVASCHACEEKEPFTNVSNVASCQETGYASVSDHGVDPASLSSIEPSMSSDQDFVPTSSPNVVSHEIEPARISKAGSTEEVYPVTMVEVGLNQKIYPMHVCGVSTKESQCEINSDSMPKVGITLGTESVGTDRELFSLHIQTCVFTEKGVDIQITKITNVLSFSCVCLTCDKTFTTHSALRLHMKTHSQADFDTCTVIKTKEKDAPEKTTASKSGLKQKRQHWAKKTSQISHEPDHSIAKKAAAHEYRRKGAALKRKSVSQKRKCGARRRKSGAQKRKTGAASHGNGDGGEGEPGTADTNNIDMTGGNTSTEDNGGDGESDRIIDGPPVEFEGFEDDGAPVTRRKAAARRAEAEADQILSCPDCGKHFTKPSVLKEHLSVHTGEKSHPCPICGRQFRLAKYVTQHMRIHTGEKTHVCAVCGKAFSKLSYLKVHMVSHSMERPHLCTVCGKMFSTLANLKDHAGMHENRTDVCTICGKVFTHRGSLSRHKKMEHEGKVEDYHCKDCGKVFKGKRRLRKHSLIHNKPYSCSECGKSFSMKYLYMDHVRIHTGEKPYSCTHCGLTYRLRTSFLEHMKKQHQNIEDAEHDRVKEDSCEEIQQTYEDQEKLSQTQDQTKQQQYQDPQPSYVAFLENPAINWNVANLVNQLADSAATMPVENP